MTGTNKYCITFSEVEKPSNREYILADLVSQGISGEELLRQFRIRQSQVRPVVEAIDKIREEHTIGEAKSGDLSGVFGYDIFYNKTNYELAYRVEYVDNKIIIVIVAGTCENLYNELKRYIKD